MLNSPIDLSLMPCQIHLSKGVCNLCKVSSQDDKKYIEGLLSATLYLVTWVSLLKRSQFERYDCRDILTIKQYTQFRNKFYWQYRRSGQSSLQYPLMYILTNLNSTQVHPAWKIQLHVASVIYLKILLSIFVILYCRQSVSVGILFL